MKILVVEDNLGILELFKDLLTYFKHDVTAITNPELGFRIQNQFDLIVSDYMFGEKKLHEYSERFDSDRLVIVSGSEFNIMCEHLQFFKKPIREEDFKSITELEKKLKRSRSSFRVV